MADLRIQPKGDVTGLGLVFAWTSNIKTTRYIGWALRWDGAQLVLAVCWGYRRSAYSPQQMSIQARARSGKPSPKGLRSLAGPFSLARAAYLRMRHVWGEGLGEKKMGRPIFESFRLSNSICESLWVPHAKALGLERLNKWKLKHLSTIRKNQTRNRL